MNPTLAATAQARKPTMGSLFAGIGGFDLGFTRAGFDVSWQVEIDPWCRKVLAKNFPKAERFEDVRDCSKYNTPWVDVIVGGFPCQDISVAGLNAGIDGLRSGLWSEYARIVGELRPKFVLVENVAALLGRGLGRVLGDLASLGYDAEWEIISAADVGAPHLRERVWILAYPRGYDAGGWSEQLQSGKPSYRESPQFLPDSCGGGGAESAGDYHKDVSDSSGGRCGTTERRKMEQPRRTEAICGGKTVSDTDGNGRNGWKGCEGDLLHEERDSSGVEQSGSERIDRIVPMDPALADTELEQRDRWSDWTCGWCREPQEALRDARGGGRQEAWMSIPESLLGRVAYGLPLVVDRLRGLGNAVVPQIPEMYARRIRALLESNQ